MKINISRAERQKKKKKTKPKVYELKQDLNFLLKNKSKNN